MLAVGYLRADDLVPQYVTVGAHLVLGDHGPLRVAEQPRVDLGEVPEVGEVLHLPRRVAAPPVRPGRNDRPLAVFQFSIRPEVRCGQVCRFPRMLVSPSYGDSSKTAQHRTHQTIKGISERLGIAIATDFAKGHEPQLAAALTKSGPGAVLICWDHAHIPALATALPLVRGTVIPRTWPADRYDVIWAFTLTADDEYSFGQVPQLLLSGDTDTIIEAG